MAMGLIFVFIYGGIGMSLVYILLHICDTPAKHEGFYKDQNFRQMRETVDYSSGTMTI